MTSAIFTPVSVTVYEWARPDGSTEVVSTFIAGADIRSVSYGTETSPGLQQGTTRPIETNFYIEVRTKQDQLIHIRLPLTTPNWKDNLDGAIEARNAFLAIAGITGSSIVADGDYGDITVSGLGTAWTIDPDAVTNAKLANVPAATFKGSPVGAGTVNPIDLTANQASTILDTATDPFVRTSAAATGDVVGPASATDNAIVRFDLATGKLIQNSGITIADGATGTLSGTNSGNETTQTVGDLINGATAKTTAVDADMFGLMDSAAGNILKKFSWLNLKAGMFSVWGALLAAATPKTTPVDGDLLTLSDSAASSVTKSLSWANVKANLKTYFDTLYSNILNSFTVTAVPPSVGAPWAVPAALTFFLAQGRWVVPLGLTYRTQIKLHVLMGGVYPAAGTKIRLLYKTQASGWSNIITDYIQLGSSGQVQVSVTGTSRFYSSGWVDLTALAKADILVAVACLDGDGVTAPIILGVYIEVR